MIKKSLALALLLACGLGHAATTCGYSTAPPAAFGAYNVFNTTAVTWQNNFTLTCTGGTGNIVLTWSKGSSTTYSPRTMKSGANVLQYNLYEDAGYTQIIGDGSAGTVTLSFTLPSGQSATGTMYGQIPASQDVAAGAYADTVVMTVNY